MANNNTAAMQTSLVANPGLVADPGVQTDTSSLTVTEPTIPNGVANNTTQPRATATVTTTVPPSTIKTVGKVSTCSASAASLAGKTYCKTVATAATIATYVEKSSVLYYKLKPNKIEHHKDLMDMQTVTKTGFDEDIPVEHLPLWLQEGCDRVMKRKIWPRIKLLGSDRPLLQLRRNKVIGVVFVGLGWVGHPDSQSLRRKYWVAIERYCHYWLETMFKRLCKNHRTMLEGAGMSSTVHLYSCTLSVSHCEIWLLFLNNRLPTR